MNINNYIVRIPKNILIMLLFMEFSNSIDYCQRSDSSCSQNSHSQYNKEYSVFLSEYHKAQKLYKASIFSSYNDTISNDLSPFKNGISKKMLESAYSKGVRYQLINHQLYRSHECIFPSRCSGVEHFLHLLREKLPDLECVINFYDWPQVNRYQGSLLPVFSFSKTDDYLDIMYPSWSFWEGGPAIKIYPKGLGRWDLHRKSILVAAEKWPWEQKKNVFFFRGSRTSSERDTLILLSRKMSDIVNASYTKNQAWKSEKDTLGFPAAEEVLLEDHCLYKYLFNFRGVTASFRFKYLFLCKSLVLHVGNEWNEFFYNELKPWIHYVPVRSNTSEKEFRELFDFILNEDKLAEEIATRGFDFIFNNLGMNNILSYWENLLLKYSKLLKFRPKLDKTLKKMSF